MIKQFVLLDRANKTLNLALDHMSNLSVKKKNLREESMHFRSNYINKLPLSLSLSPYREILKGLEPKSSTSNIMLS